MKFDHFADTSILREIKFWWIQTVQKMSFLAILEVLNSDSVNLSKFQVPYFRVHSSESLKLHKMTFLDNLNAPKFDFT